MIRNNGIVVVPTSKQMSMQIYFQNFGNVALFSSGKMMDTDKEVDIHSLFLGSSKSSTVLASIDEE